MRALKFLLFAGLILAVTGTAGATNLNLGLNEASLSDASHLWNPPGATWTPVPGAPYWPGQSPLPALGQENRAIVNLKGIEVVGSGNPTWTGSAGTGTVAGNQLSGLFYDLAVIGVNPVFGGGGGLIGAYVSMGSLVRNPLIPAVDDLDGDSAGAGMITGGVVEIYEDFGKTPTMSNYSVAPGPGAWVMSDPTATVPGRDSYPAINQAGSPNQSLWLQAAFVDLANLNPFPGGPPLPAGTVFAEYLDFVQGTGSGIGYLNVFDGSIESAIGRGTFGISPSGVPMDIRLRADYAFSPNPGYNPGINPTAAAGWINQSNDPADFWVIPEPITMVGAFLGTMTLGGYIRRRMSA